MTIDEDDRLKDGFYGIRHRPIKGGQRLIGLEKSQGRNKRTKHP